MNDEFSARQGENEEVSTEIRRPIRRARRTVAPFSELRKNDAELEKELCTAEEESAPALPFEEAEIAEEAAPALTTEEETVAEEAATEEKAEEALEAEEERFTLSSEESVEDASELTEDAAEEVSAEDNGNTEEEIEDAPVADGNAEEKDELSPAASTFDWVKSFLFSLTAVIFVFTLLFRGVTVNGVSMLPTLSNAEYLIISDLLYTPKTGDIVVVQSPHYKEGKEPLIKRIIATGGQKVKINFNTWEVWVDGKKLNEDYILKDSNTRMDPEDMAIDENGIVEFRVDQNCVFVMGDHRNDSLDSRSNSVGQIDERYIMGRVLLRITPFEKFGKVE